VINIEAGVKNYTFERDKDQLTGIPCTTKTLFLSLTLLKTMVTQT